MDDLLKGVTLISIFSVIYKTIVMLSAQKTDTIFYTVVKSKLAELLRYLYYFLGFNIAIFVCPLAFDVFVPNHFILVIFAGYLIVFSYSVLLININNTFKFNKKKKLINTTFKFDKIDKIIHKYYYNKSLWVILFLSFLLYGVLLMLYCERMNNGFYENYQEALAISFVWSIISILLFYMYLSDFNNVIRQVCWFEYRDPNETEGVKYYIFHASDSEYVVCGKNDKYENNIEYKFINIKELKEKYIIHIEKINER